MPRFAIVGVVRCLGRRRALARRFLSRDLLLKYRGSSLGFFWSLLGPLLLMLVYTVVFSVVVRIPTPVPYPLFVLSGLLPWLFTARALERACHSLLGHGAFLQKVYCPREVLVLSGVGVQLVDLALSLVVLLLLGLFLGPGPSVSILWLPVYVGLHVALVFGIALALSVGTVLFRDLLPIVEVGLQIWFYLSPILYPAELAASMRWGWLYGFNPMAGIVEGYRACLLGVPGPPAAWLLWSGAAAILSLVVGAGLFRRFEAQAVKEL